MPAPHVQYCNVMDGRWGGGVRPAPVCPSVEAGVLVSTSCYHGFQPVRQPDSPHQESAFADAPMEIDADIATTRPRPSNAPPLASRKRSAEDVEAPQLKRLRAEESQQSTGKSYKEYFVGATLAKPDVSRCFMAHMI